MRDNLIRAELLAHIEVAMKAGGSPERVLDMVATCLEIKWCGVTRECPDRQYICDRPKGHRYMHKTSDRIRFY